MGAPRLKARLDATDPKHILVCSVVKGELFFGAARSRDPAKALSKQRFFLSRFESLPFDDAAADPYAEIRADLTGRGLIIGPKDLMIAAICRARDVTLVTHNVAEFGRIKRLQIEDWEV